MNKRIISRDDLLLAKIAGHEVDLSTMTPPNVLNAREQYLLEIAEKLNNQGNNSSVNNIMVVTLTESDEWSYEANASIFEIAKAADANVPVFIRFGDNIYHVETVQFNDDGTNYPIVIKAYCSNSDTYSARIKMLYGQQDQSGDDHWIVYETGTNSVRFGAVVEEDEQTGPIKITLYVRADNLYTYITSGRPITISARFGEGEDLIEMTIPIEVYKLNQKGSNVFKFRSKGNVEDPNTTYESGYLSGGDTVVMIEVGRD